MTIDIRYFYQGTQPNVAARFRVVTRFLRAGSLPLAETEHEALQAQATLLTADNNHSVLNRQDGDSKPSSEISYTAYGLDGTLLPLQQSFNGLLKNVVHSLYSLGNGARTYSPTRMRFYQADTYSPFGAGGINAYVYCHNDPINFIDPSGHVRGRSPSRLNTPPLSPVTTRRPLPSPVSTPDWGSVFEFTQERSRSRSPITVQGSPKTSSASPAPPQSSLAEYPINPGNGDRVLAKQIFQNLPRASRPRISSTLTLSLDEAVDLSLKNTAEFNAYRSESAKKIAIFRQALIYSRYTNLGITKITNSMPIEYNYADMRNTSAGFSYWVNQNIRGQ